MALKIELKNSAINFSDAKQILIITIVMMAILIAVGLISSNVGVLGILIIIGVFINISPQVILLYQKYRQIKEMEEKFPAFLRDLTESIRSGLPFHKAIIASAKIDYGTLTAEVKKMAHQLSWGVPLDKVLDKFAERMKSSKRLYTSAKIIRESFLSGGEVISTLESVAESATNLEEAEKEKKSLLNQYVVLMYAISIIFVIIISAINKFLIPIFQTAGNTAASGAVQSVVSLENPCNTCVGLECGICDFYNSVAYVVVRDPTTGQAIDPVNITVYYTALFFLMALIQSILSGLVAGQISEGSMRAGIKHAMILAGITVGSFLMMIKFGFLGI